MKHVELTKKMVLEVPENINSIIDGDQLEKCFDAIIRQYYKTSNHMDGALIERVKNAILNIPDIYLYTKD